MDKSKLKKVIQQFLTSLEVDGYPISFAGIPPLLPEYETPYNLQLYSTKLLEMGIYDAIVMIVNREHTSLSIEVRKLISRIEICRKPEDIVCRKEDIIINKIKYKPLEIPYQMLEMA
jgi:hypothetical protein